MNEYAAYINTAMPSCGGTRVFVAPGYNYNASERLILGEQSKSVRDCYWLMAQEQNLEWESLGDRLVGGNTDVQWNYAYQPPRGQVLREGAPLHCTPKTWITDQPYARPTYRM